MANIGSYRTQLTRRTATAVRVSANGQTTYTYADGAVMWANVQEASANEAIAAGAAWSLASLAIRVRGWQTTLEFVDRLKDAALSEEYTIDGIYRDRRANELVVIATRAAG